MCDQRFIDEQWPGIRNAMVEYMAGCIGRNQNPRYPENGWFYKNYEWPKESGIYECDTIETFVGYSMTLGRIMDNIPEGLDINNLRQNFYNNHECDNANIITRLRNSIIDILVEWGGTLSPQKDDNGEYLETGYADNGRGVGLREVIDPWIPYIVTYKNDNYANLNIEEPGNVTQILTIAMEESNYRIASWSKVLAALAWGKFFIYDSRVAIALSYFSMKAKQPCFWEIPDPRKPDRRKQLEGNRLQLSDDQIAEIIRIYNKNPFENFQQRCDKYRRDREEKDIPTCYYCYLNLLKTLAEDTRIIRDYNTSQEAQETRSVLTAYRNAHLNEMQAIMAHIEKMLFMLADEIQGKTKKERTKNGN